MASTSSPPLGLWTLSQLLGSVMFVSVVMTFFSKVISTRLSLLQKPLPPGPSFLSRILESRRRELPVFKFMRWSEKYRTGVISLLDYAHLGEVTIVLGTPEACVDLLEKRGNIYSSRTKNIIAGDICYRGCRGSFQPVGPMLKKFRTLMSATMSPDASKKFRPLENLEINLLLRDLLLDPDHENYAGHIHRSVHSIAFYTAYGRRIDYLEVKLAELHKRMDKFFASHTIPGNYLVDHFPVLLQFPRMLQWFRREAEKQGNEEEGFFQMCRIQTKGSMDNGIPMLGTCAAALSKQEKYGFSDLELAMITGAPYTAGVTTTYNAFKAFLLAILLNPWIMKKAQDEISRIVGTHRMPDFDDFDRLPYISAIIKETLRWYPPSPFTLPHSVTEDDLYRGMFIPKGSTVIVSIYAITRNTELFPEPEEFEPERFINSGDERLKNFNMTFGLGRRICPGQHLVVDQLFLLITRILWAFNVVPLEADLRRFRQQQESHPKFGAPTLCPHRFVPRGSQVRSTILEQALVAEDEAKIFECFRFET